MHFLASVLAFFAVLVVAVLLSAAILEVTVLTLFLLPLLPFSDTFDAVDLVTRDPSGDLMILSDVFKMSRSSLGNGLSFLETFLALV